MKTEKRHDFRDGLFCQFGSETIESNRHGRLEGSDSAVETLSTRKQR